MTRIMLWAVPLLAAAAALLGWIGAGAGVIAAAVAGTLAAGVLWSVEAARLRTASERVTRWEVEGSSVPLRASGAPPWRELGERVDGLGVALRQARAELRSIEPWTDTLVHSLDGPALVFAADDRLVTANAAAEELFGLPRWRREGTTVLRALGSTALVGAVAEAREVARMVQVGAEVAGRDLRVTASPMDDLVLVLVTDRTEQRRVEELRRDFVTNASHELKTPAAAIQALAEALAVVSDDRREQLIERLGEESDRLVRMVHDLLDLRRLEDPGPLERRPVDLVAVVADVLEELRHEIDARDLEVERDLPPSAHVAGVPADLRLVVANLLGNAVQYNSEGGSVEVSLRAEHGQYRLAVRDSGIGIARADVSRIFERFYRVDVARSRARGGTGLGLSIVRHAVERHGGSVAVESLLGSGSTFTVNLPIEPPVRTRA